MAYSETKVIMGGLAHVPILVFLVNLIKNKFEVKAEVPKVAEVKVKEPKVAEVKVEEPKVAEVKVEEPKVAEVNREEGEEIS